MFNAFCLVLLILPVTVPDKETKLQNHAKLTVVLCGAENDADVEVLTKALRTVKGLKVLSDNVRLGFRKFDNRFTTPIVVTIPLIPGSDDAKVGSIAKAVSKAKTSNPKEYPPGVNLILFTDDALDEESISDLRTSLSGVNGVEVNRPGGLGGNIKDGWCWVRLENAGGAMLNEIEDQTRRSIVNYRRLQQKTD